MVPRLTEQQLFNYWRLIYWFDLGKEKGKDSILLSFKDLYTKIDQSLGCSVFNIIQLFNILNIDFKTIRFNKKEFLFWDKDKKIVIQDFLKSNSDTKIGKTIKRVFSNNISKKDLEEMIISKKDVNVLLNYIDFGIEEKDIIEIKSFLKEYIQFFMDNNLIIEKQNFYNFKVQKEKTKNLLKQELDFGKNFIIRYDPTHPFLGDKAFLFIHTLIALEYLGCLKVEELYTFYCGENPKTNTKDYKAKILLRDEFFSEDDLEKKNKYVFSEKIKFNNSILFFNDKEFDFRNSPNQCELLNTLFKDTNKTWYYDEIQEDWDPKGYEEALRECNYWRKFYTSADEVNVKIAIKTGIEDFLIKNTKKIQINPKYR